MLKSSTVKPTIKQTTDREERRAHTDTENDTDGIVANQFLRGLWHGLRSLGAPENRGNCKSMNRERGQRRTSWGRCSEGKP